MANTVTMMMRYEGKHIPSPSLRKLFERYNLKHILCKVECEPYALIVEVTGTEWDILDLEREST
jgi:hypothetical protein